METITKRKYDTFVVYLYNRNKEHLLPEDFKRQIPASTLSTWRSIDYDSYCGSCFRSIQKEGIEYYELFLEYKNLKRTFHVLAKVWVRVSDLLLPAIRKNKEQADIFIDEVQRLCTVFKKKTALHIAGISPAAFAYRLSLLKNKCAGSPHSLCFKRHPLQLSLTEMKTIRKLLADTRYACWPVTSLYWYARRKGMLSISLSTLYKYAYKLGLQRKFKPSPMKTKGLRASRPNQYLHVDTTYWPLENNRKCAVVFVSDNYSRAILGWSMDLKNSAANVISALQMAMQTMRGHYPDRLCASLVADGGGENHAVTVENLLSQTSHPRLTKIIAQKDIVYSNSPVEAINKVIKRYLRHSDPRTPMAVYSCIKQAVFDYSFVRPHGSLHGLIPMEVYTQKKVNMDFTVQSAQAKALRIAENRKTNCGIC